MEYCAPPEYAGIFGYLNYLVPATRKEILEKLINGLKRLEYRGYDSAEFVVVHNGIITNYKDLKAFLQKKGFEFESETDTEL
ncbi:hypothetical protein KUTeg_003292 [Tegillarca granosa]|uniref:glutamine--fructose-6-phosphate transaminase (isomerizing) n=1 Tax=Tegillarca granosa TaxID=220873 RepID=A0ABQ9FLP4_TEGGR|nr:hypothetical protein KUTeg_003292 [Tegillarca granosa]